MQAGKSGDLKESVLGVEVFGREPGYDSHSYSVVRVEFSRLRRKLEQYYQTEGREDTIRIAFLRGSYVPEFTWVNETTPVRSQPPLTTPLAVLPFTHLGSNADDEYFAAGLTEELITALGRVRGLRVVGRASSFALHGRTRDIREIGQTLKVDAVLAGSVRRHDSRLRIHAQLIDAADETQLWAEKYERQVTDVFEIQDEITAAIVAALELELPRAASRVAASGTRSVRAHELYLKGRYWWHRSNPWMYARAADLFREAIACDPSYAAPYSGLADACFNRAMYGDSPPGEMIQQAEAAARKALELDESSAEAHCSMGLIEGGLNWNAKRCEIEFRRCMELNPSYALGLAKYGTSFLSPLGRFEEAHDYICRALELDPLSPNLQADLAMNFLFRGQMDRFETEARKVLQLAPGVSKLHIYLITSLGVRGNWSAAVDAADTACAMFAENPYILAHTAWAYEGSGQTVQAKAIQDRLVTRARTQYMSAIALALTHLHSDTNAVFEKLEEAYERHEPLLRYMIWQSCALRGLHSDTRFQDLKRRVGL